MSSTGSQSSIGVISADNSVVDKDEELNAAYAKEERATKLPWIMMALMTVFRTGQEWYDWANDIPPQPTQVTIVSGCIVGFAFWKLKQRARLKKAIATAKH